MALYFATQIKVEKSGRDVQHFRITGEYSKMYLKTQIYIYYFKKKEYSKELKRFDGLKYIICHLAHDSE